MNKAGPTTANGKDGARVVTFVFVGVTDGNIPSFGGSTIFQDAEGRAAVFDLPSDAVRAAVEAIAQAPAARYAGVATGEFDPAAPQTPIDRLRAIASVGERGQVMVTLITRELAKSSLPAEYEFHGLGSTHLANGEIEHLLLAGHPSLVLSRSEPLPKEPLARKTTFIGRAREIEEVRRQIDRARIVTVTGPSGLGKSSLLQRLITEFDGDYTDGVAKLDLSGLSQAALVEPALIRLLEAPKLPGEDHLQALIAFLRPRKFLLVLDNAEHLLAEVRRIVVALSDACPDLAILIGSQRVLRVAGESRYRLEGLEVPSFVEDWRAMADYDAIALFVDRAKLIDIHFTLGPDNASDVATLCRRLDGIPLAIEMAAAKTKALSPHQILGRLDEHRFILLKDSDSARPDRQKTLERTVDWSYRLLREESRVLMRRLSVFSGAFTVDQASQVCADDTLSSHHVLAAFEELVDASMVTPSNASGAVKRFRLLETTRLYARDRLRSAGEAPQFQARHRAWCVDFANRVETDMYGRDQKACLERIDASYEDLRHTIEWHLGKKGDPNLAVRMLLAIHPYYFLRHFINEGLRLTRKVVDTPVTREVPDITRAYNLASLFASRVSDEESARAYAIRSVMAARRTNNDSALARARNSLGYMAQDAGRLEKARRHFAGAVQIFRELGDQTRMSRVLINLASLEATLGRVEDAEARLRECEPILRGDPDPSVWGYFHQNAAHVALSGRLPMDALRHVREALAVFNEVQDLFGFATCMRNAAHSYELLALYRESTIFVGAALAFGKRAVQHVHEFESEGLRALIWRLSSTLGSETYEGLLFEGRQMTVENALVHLDLTLNVSSKQ